MLNELDSIRLIKPLPENSVPVGSLGVVLMVYTNPLPGYEVEFFDEFDKSFGNFTTYDEYIEKVEY